MATKKNSQPKKDNDDYEHTLPVSDDEDSNGDPINEEFIFPGLILKNDYVLLKKIGFGNNASVWMVYQISTKFYLAIKIQDYQCYEDGLCSICGNNINNGGSCLGDRAHDDCQYYGGYKWRDSQREG